ncbi:MAG: phosphatase PAP2 family protein [Thermodesulfovibrionales bacterium]
MHKLLRIKGKVLFLLLLLDIHDSSYASEFSAELGALRTNYKDFYLSKENLFHLSAGIGVAAILAHTSIDKEVQGYYQENIRGETTNYISRPGNILGTSYITVPLLFITKVFTDIRTKEWADKSLRAILVGAPAGLIIQSVTGASRPEEGDSRWHPFKDSNGLSGHAFIGSVPFITAAISSNDIRTKIVFYTLSTLPGLSRINDNKHYLSQSFLGWYLGYLSCQVVDKKKEEPLNIVILPSNKGAYVVLSYIIR